VHRISVKFIGEVFSCIMPTSTQRIISTIIYFTNPRKKKRSRDSAVDIATGYGLDDGGVGVQVQVESRIVSSPRRPNRLWGPLSLPSSGYRGLFPRGKAAGA
jgi:hypothetical protein